MARNLLPLAGVFIVLVFLIVWSGRFGAAPETPGTGPDGAPASDEGPRDPKRSFTDSSGDESPARELATTDDRSTEPAEGGETANADEGRDDDGPGSERNPTENERKGDDGLGAPEDPRLVADPDGRTGRDSNSERASRDARVADWMTRVRAHAADAERISARVRAGEGWRAEDYNDRAENLAAELALEIGAEPADAYLTRVPLYKIDLTTGERFRVDVAGNRIDG